MLRAFPSVDVVAASVKDDLPGPAGSDDPFKVIDRVDNLRTAKSAIDHLMSLKVFRQCLPEADARTANEQNSAFGGRIGLVARLEGFDLRFKWRLAGLGQEAGRGEQQQRRFDGGQFHKDGPISRTWQTATRAS